MKNILLFDEDTQFLTAFSENLAKYQLPVFATGSYDDALMSAQRHKPTLMLVGLTDEFSGIKLVSMLRITGYDPNVLFLTGSDRQREDVAMFNTTENTLFSVISKSESVEKVIDKIKSIGL